MYYEVKIIFFYFINFLSFYLVLKNKQKVELLMLSARLFTSKFKCNLQYCFISLGKFFMLVFHV